MPQSSLPFSNGDSVLMNSVFILTITIFTLTIGA